LSHRQLPTTETGLKLSFRLTEKSHRRMFRDLFDRIVWNGGIRATMNGANAHAESAVKESFSD
jgi:fido (protein-threonine AMPylation protein)